MEETTTHGVALDLPLGAREAIGQDSRRALCHDYLLEAARDVIERFIPAQPLKLATTFRAASPQGIEHTIGTVDPIEVMVDLGAERPMGKGVSGVTHKAHGAVSLDGDYPGAPVRAVMRTCAWDSRHREPSVHACFSLR